MTNNHLETMRARIERVRQNMDHGLDALIVTSYENAFYLSGVFLYYNAVIIPRQGDPILLVKHLDLEVARQGSWFNDIRGYSLYPVDRPGVMVTNYAGAMAQTLCDLGLANGRIGMGDYWALLRPFQELTELLPKAEIVTAPTILENVRLVKDAVELELMTQTAEIADQAITAVAHHLHPGVREFELAAEAAHSAWKAAPGSTLWHAIVASGPHALSPHAEISDRALQVGDNVVVDLVVGYAGYYAGVTRTFVVAEASTTQERAYQALLTTREVIQQEIKAGMPMSDIMTTARRVLSEQGFARYIKHSMGHSIGTFPHEQPFLTQQEKRPLEENMVFCLEPAVYVENLGGFRVGDEMLVTSDGMRPLTKASHQLVWNGKT